MLKPDSLDLQILLDTIELVRRLERPRFPDVPLQKSNFRLVK